MKTGFVKKMKRIFAIMNKELLQIRRDSRSLVLALFAPAALVVLFGYALSMDVRNVRYAVCDQDRSTASRQLLEKLVRTEYFSLQKYIDDVRDADALLDDGEVVMVLVIPSGFSSDLRRGRQVDVQLLVDGTDSLSSAVAMGYVQAILMEYNSGFSGSGKVQPAIDVRSRVWYNETLESKFLVIPGLIVIILAIISALITSLTVSREWERGTMESLITTPLRPAELYWGKALAYMLIGAFDVALTFIAGYVFFDVGVTGSFAELFLLSMLFLLGTTGLGFLISAATRVQVLSIQVAIVITYLPSLILSGFIFPIGNMPVVIRVITHIVPASYMMNIIKSIALKGLPATMLPVQILFMALFAAVISFLAIKKISMMIPED